MLTTIRYILITALRDWLFIGLMIGVLCALYVSSFLGSVALLENTQMSLAFAGESTRLVLIVGLIVFTCFHIRHAFDSKEIDVIVSRPISRTKLVLAYWLGFAVVAVLLVVPTLAVLGLIGVLNSAGYLMWGGSLLLEALLLIAFALFAALTMRSAVASVLMCLGFYVLCRLMGFLIATTQSQLMHTDKWIDIVAKYITQGVSLIIPRLDFFTKSEWLVYGPGAGEVWWLMIIQAAVFIPILLVAAILDFRRKQF